MYIHTILLNSSRYLYISINIAIIIYQYLSIHAHPRMRCVYVLISTILADKHVTPGETVLEL